MTPFASGPPGYSPPAASLAHPGARLVPPSPTRLLLRALVLGLGLAVALGACGRRGPLEAPLGGQALPGDELAREGQQAPPTIAPVGRTRGGRQPITVPKEPFILDPIL